jgi:hypothetical protein
LPNDTEGIQHLFNSISSRTDIVLENASWISEWNGNVESRSTAAECDDRANIRMVGRYNVGKVFLAGGTQFRAGTSPYIPYQLHYDDDGGPPTQSKQPSPHTHFEPGYSLQRFPKRLAQGPVRSSALGGGASARARARARRCYLPLRLCLRATIPHAGRGRRGEGERRTAHRAAEEEGKFGSAARPERRLISSRPIR